MKTKQFLITAILVLLFSISLNAQQLIYKPVNPAFGGSPLNYSWMLSSANAQNPYDESGSGSGLKNSAVGNFSDSVKRQILNNLTRGLFSDENGNPGEGIEPGTFEAGGLVINIVRTRTGMLITVIDSDTGETTEIII